MTIAILSARLDVLSTALQAIMTDLEPAQAEHVTAALRRRLGAADFSPDADAAAAAELSSLLNALGTALER
jgi:hypothetical protein